MDTLRPLAEELRKINLLVSNADTRTVTIEKRYAELTNQLSNKFVDIVGKHVKQQLGKTISSSQPTQQAAEFRQRSSVTTQLLPEVEPNEQNDMEDLNDCFPK